MNILRIILYAAFALVFYLLLINWQHDYKETPPQERINVEFPHNKIPNDQPTNALLPSIETPATTTAITSTENKPSQTTVPNKSYPLIKVKTNVLNLLIDLAQGNIINAKLLDYPISTEAKNTPITLLQYNSNHSYVANSSLVVNKQQHMQNIDINFTSKQLSYELPTNQSKLTVQLQGKTNDGLEVIKEFSLSKDSYVIAVKYFLKNTGTTVWQGHMNAQLFRAAPEEDESSIFHVGSYTGASYSNPGQQRYKKITFKAMTKNNLNINANGGWVAMQQHYFLTAWIPTTTESNLFYTKNNNDKYTIGMLSQPLLINPGEQKEIGANLYVGPEIASVLKNIAPGLDLTIDYGILWFISSILFSLMKAIYSVIGNWGWSIVLVTVLIKLAFYRLSATSYKSMAGIRKLQPKLQALRERYGDDKLKISQATMELYRQEKVNPLGGCLPILIQIPVFIALYWVLLESVELRQAPFILWITDLASKDQYHVLPLIMGGTMLVQQQLNPAPPDPIQAKVMMFLPLLFTALFWNFPAGLVLYWIVNNALSILQQWYITRAYGDPKPKKNLVSAKKNV